MIDCVKSFVGATRNTCPCDSTDLPAGFDPTASTMGYYLSDVLPHKAFQFLECGDQSIWHRLYDTRNRTVLEFESMLQASILETHKPVQTWSGLLGEAITRDATVNGSLHGLRIEANSRKGSFIYISKVRLISNESGDYNLTIKSSDGLYTYEQEVGFDISETNKWKEFELDTPQKLPLWNDSNETLYYFIYWDNEESVNNKRKCPTCTGRLPYDYFFKVDGVYSTDGNSWTTSEYQYGVLPDVQVLCGLDYAVCHSSEMAKLHVAIAFAHSWALNVIDDIIKDPEPSKWTILGAEDLGIYRGDIEAKMRDNTDRAISFMDFGACFSCSPRVYRGSILR